MAKSDYTTLLNLPGSVSFFAITAMRDLMLPNMLGGVGLILIGSLTNLYPKLKAK